MRRMGGTCSMQRQDSSIPGNTESARNHGNQYAKYSADSKNRKLSRHSVLQALPDGTIAHLYPVSDNYIKEDGGTRSPKSLAELCVDTLCRSLAYLDGELPPGLPQDVVDDLVSSLVRHNALNLTTLRVLKNCELGSLTLSGCRGVGDEWLVAFASQRSCPSTLTPSSMESESPSSTTTETETMDLDCNHQIGPEVFYNTLHTTEDDSCSSTSFLSARSAVQTTSTDALVPLDDSIAGNFSHQETCSETKSATGNLTMLDLRGSQRLTDKGLINLADLSRLEIARLDNCYSIVGRGLLAFSMSHHLHTLSMANCRRLTDEAIINISHLTSLEALSLDGCRCLSDQAVIALSGLVNLKKLGLSQCDLITDQSMHALENMNELDELSLGWCRQISDDGIGTLTKQPGRSISLKVLSLARCSMSDDGIQHLSRLHALQELDLNGCINIGSLCLGRTLDCLKNLQGLDVSYCPGILRSSWQGKIQSLKRLDLCYSGVRDSHMAKLKDLPNLEELSLDSCDIGDWSIAHFADNEVVPNLKALDLADTDLSDLGMVHIGKFLHLKRLSLFYCNISNGGLRHISSLTELEVLNMDSRDIGDEGLWHLRNLRKLKSLDIFSGRITDAGCAHLARIKSLESLELCGGGIGDLGCAMLANLENLTCLNLSQNEYITNRGAAALASLSNLKTLNLSNTRVNSSALVFFSDLMKLQSLAVYGCRGMDESEGLDRLQKELPSLKCVRVNSEDSNEDGKVRIQGEETDDETTDDEDFEMGDDVAYTSLHHYDDDSEMEEDGSQHLSEISQGGQGSSRSSTSSYSDHD